MSLTVVHFPVAVHLSIVGVEICTPSAVASFPDVGIGVMEAVWLLAFCIIVAGGGLTEVCGVVFVDCGCEMADVGVVMKYWLELDGILIVGCRERC